MAETIHKEPTSCAQPGDVSRVTEIFTAKIKAQIRLVLDGRRKQVDHQGKLCSCCYGPKEEGRTDPYCRECRKIYMQKWRKVA